MNIIVVLPTPEFKVHLPNLVANALNFNADVESFELQVESYNERSAEVRNILLDVGAEFFVDFIDPKNIYCSATTCRIWDLLDRVLYGDSNHLSYFGSQPLVNEVMSLVIGIEALESK